MTCRYSAVHSKRRKYRWIRVWGKALDEKAARAGDDDPDDIMPLDLMILIEIGPSRRHCGQYWPNYINNLNR